jgi:hypothetical protein
MQGYADFRSCPALQARLVRSLNVWLLLWVSSLLPDTLHMHRYKPPRSLLLGLGLFAVAAALGLAGDLWLTQRCLETSGRQVEAVVAAKWTTRGKSTSYHLDYHFRSEAGENVASTERVSRAVFDRAWSGGPVRVSYCSGEIRRHHVDPQTQHRNMVTSLLMAVIMAIGLAIWTVVDRLSTARNSEARGREPGHHERAWADPLANGLRGARDTGRLQ